MSRHAAHEVHVQAALGIFSTCFIHYSKILAFNIDGKIYEQRVYCKIRAQLGFPPTEIHADLQKVYGNDALKYATVCKWVRRFNDGWESIENDPQVGRPISVFTEKNVATVKVLIEEDTCYTGQEIEELSGIHS